MAVEPRKCSEAGVGESLKRDGLKIISLLLARGRDANLTTGNKKFKESIY